MKRQHFHLISGTVMFMDQSSGEPKIGNFLQNTTIHTPTREVPSRHIGRAQQALQMLMYRKLEDDNLVVVDVHINSVSYLGLMTEEDFLEPLVASEEAQPANVPTPIDPRLN